MKKNPKKKIVNMEKYKVMKPELKRITSFILGRKIWITKIPKGSPLDKYVRKNVK